MSAKDYVDSDDDGNVILTGLPGRLVKYVDMPAEEAAFLLNKVGDSTSIKSTVESLFIKLKLEFSEELAKEREHIDERNRERAKVAAQQRIYKHVAYKRAFEHIKLRRDELKLDEFMRHNRVRRIEDIPDDLKHVFIMLDWHKCIHRPLITRWRMIKNLPAPDQREQQVGIK